MPLDARRRAVRSESSKPRMNDTQETRPELESSLRLHLHHEMRRQSLRAPWREVAAACVRLLEWRSFALWVRAICDAERMLPNWLADTIENRCPAFLQSRCESIGVDSIWADLGAWIDNHYFSDAVEQGWIKALHYYSGRLPESERLWAHWTRVDEEWRRERPSQYPSFEQWKKDVSFGSATSLPIATTVAQFVELEAFAFWVRSLVEAAHEVPTIVREALDNRCPGFLSHVLAQNPRPCSDPQWMWQQLLIWIESHFFAEAVRDSWIETLRAAGRRHLRAERVAAFWAACGSAWTKAPPTGMPSFEHWLAQADVFVVS